MNKTKSARSFIALVCVSLAVPAAVNAQVTLKVGDAEGTGGSEVVVPILISGSRNVGPMQFILDYDRRILEAIPDPPGAEPRAVVFGDMVDGGMISHNVAAPGEVGIALRTDEPIGRDGELLHVRFLVTGEKGDRGVISIAAAEAWEKESLAEVPVVTEPGTFAVVGGFGLLVPLIAGAIGLLLAVLYMVRRKMAHAPRPQPAAAAAAPTGEPAAPVGSGAADDTMAALKKLKEMQESELISQDDFERKKGELLKRM